MFDPRVLHALADEPDRGFVVGLVRTYLRLLPTRVDRLVAAIGASDVEGALDVCLSLKVSSSMTGAVDLADLAAHLESDLKSHDLDRARTRAASLPRARELTAAAVNEYLSSVPATA